MTPDEIKSRIKEKGISQNRMARRVGASPTSLSFIINGKLKSDKIEKRLAKQFGLTLEEFRGEAVA